MGWLLFGIFCFIGVVVGIAGMIRTGDMIPIVLVIVYGVPAVLCFKKYWDIIHGKGARYQGIGSHVAGLPLANGVLCSVVFEVNGKNLQIYSSGNEFIVSFDKISDMDVQKKGTTYYLVVTYLADQCLRSIKIRGINHRKCLRWRKMFRSKYRTYTNAVRL